MPSGLKFGPRRSYRRQRLLLLICITLPLTAFIAHRQGWQPPQALADLRQDVMPYVPATIPNLPSQAESPASDTVVMAESTIIENPQSEAYTAGLHAFTGKDDIPWPNIDGRTQVELYTVQPGDSLWSIADRYGLDLDTLRWSNPELARNSDILSVGTELRILPVTGVYHLISPDDTIESIAAQYGVAPEDITDYPPNALFPPYELAELEGIIVPYGRKD